jgi:hypothetical protein
MSINKSMTPVIECAFHFVLTLHQLPWRLIFIDDIRVTNRSGLGTMSRIVYGTFKIDQTLPGFIKRAALRVITDIKVLFQCGRYHSGLVIHHRPEYPGLYGSFYVLGMGRLIVLAGIESQNYYRKKK